MGASAAAAIIIKREKDIVAHFRSLGAVDPESAQTAQAINVEQGTAWRFLVSDAVIRTAPNGKFYLDEPSWVALGRRRRRVLFVLLVVVLFALGAALFATAKSRG